MKFIRKNYLLCLHLTILAQLLVIGTLVYNLVDLNNEFKKVEYVKDTIFVQTVPDVTVKTEEKILIDYSIAKYSKMYGVDEALVRSLVKHESGFNPRALSEAGCAGLMQLSPDKTSKPFDIDENLNVGIKYLAHLIKLYDGNVTKALHGYNCGVGNVARNTIPSSTRRYAQNILADKGEY